MQREDLILSELMQPLHLFFSLKCAMHTPQLIPQGAINSLEKPKYINLLCLTCPNLYKTKNTQ